MPAILLLALALGLATGDAPPDPGPSEVRAAVEKAVPRVEASLREYVHHRKCFSCHHQGLGLLALTTARGRGIRVDGELIDRQSAFTEADLKGAIDSYRKGRGQGGGVTRAGYALWALEQGGRPPSETTSAVADFLLGNGKDGWRSSNKRPPSEASPFTATYVALRGLRKFSPPEAGDRVAGRVAKARSWLLATPAADTEERVFRLWGLRLTSADDDAIRAAARDLRDARRPDGGWSQTADMGSDAYATGSALVALRQTDQISANDPIYLRGLSFLIRSQLPDGSWHVASRSRPFQTYFESGFPHGKDQFLSMAATGWAATALALALPEVP